MASVLGFTSLGRRLMDRLPGPWWLQVVVGSGLVLGIGRLATLPFALGYRNVLLDYGLTNQPLRGWLRDAGVSFGLGWLVSALVLLVLIGSARRWERAWPVVAGTVLAGLVMAASFVYPVLVEPLFNHFESLPEGSLRTSILRLADEEGVRVDDVLVTDASRRTTTLNAYVSGYGDTRRVVVYDNLVNDLPEDQTLSVVAHELAHAKHNDPLVGSVLGAVGTFAAVGLLGLVLGIGASRREGRRAGTGRCGAPGAGTVGLGDVGGKPDREHGLAADRDPGRCRRVAHDPRSGRVHRSTKAAGGAGSE